MTTYAKDQPLKSPSGPVAHAKAQSFQFKDDRARNSSQIQLKEAIHSSPRVSKLEAKAEAISEGVLQKKANQTGLPDQLKSGIEQLSGLDMSDTRVHYNSSKPAQLNAHAYAQGTDIHMAPGQEKHLAHEAWHVVQQKQGRVQPTTQLKSKTLINDDVSLEREADVMGAKAMSVTNHTAKTLRKQIAGEVLPVQRVTKKSGNTIASGEFQIKMEDAISLKLETPTKDTEVTYTPKATANDANPIVLDQIVRSENIDIGLSNWSGDPEERREKLKVGDGWFMDHMAQANQPRTKADDPEVSTAYVEASKINIGSDQDPEWKSYKDYEGTDVNKNGKKHGRTIESAVLTDHPASTQPYNFQAEVIAKGKEGDATVVYGSAKWSFKTKKKGGQGADKDDLVKDSFAISFHDSPSENYKKALDKYHEVYRNKSAATSPEHVAQWITQAKKANATPLQKAEAKVALAKIIATIRVNQVKSDRGILDADQSEEIKIRQVHGIQIYQYDQTEEDAYREVHGETPYEALKIAPNSSAASEHSSEE
jgi:hypothetical protein